MKILIAMDSFFNKLHSHHANQYVFDGVKAVDKDANIVMVPLFESDNNIIDALLVWEKGRKIVRRVMDNQLQEKDVEVAILNQHTMLIDAKALVSSNNSPQQTSSYGLGQLIQQGLDLGMKSFIISIGKLMIFDAGLGMLQAFGAKFHHRDYALLESPLTQSDLKDIRYIELSDIDDRLKGISLTIVSDDNYQVYGKDSHIAHTDLAFDEKQVIDNSIWYITQQFNKSGIDLNAALNGGDGGAIRAVFEQMFNATIKTSAQLIFERTHIGNLIEEADIVIYGGGSIDETHGSLVVQQINQLQHADKINLYLSAGKQYMQKNDNNVIELNVYPEISENTEPIQIGMQLQNAVKNIILATQKG